MASTPTQSDQQQEKQSVEQQEPPSVELQDTPSVEQQDPPFIEQQDPPSLEQQDTPSIEQQDPPSIMQQDPPSIVQQEPASVQHQEPPTAIVVQVQISRTTDESEVTIDYYVENASQIQETVVSPPTYVRSLPWELTMAQSEDGDGRSLSFSLQCNGTDESAGWSCNAEVELRIHSSVQDVPPIERQLKHRFCAEEKCSAFVPLVSWAELLDAEKCYINDDTIEVELATLVIEPAGIGMDSKSSTGYVGMVNQGATCYLNSMLQTLFFTNQMRKAVYQMKTVNDDSSVSVGLGLQRVFHDLQCLQHSVSTKPLTQSFGWQGQDLLAQHDVQESLRLLLSTLEKSGLSGTVRRLFRGRVCSYIKCMHVNYQSSRQEPFYDIQLNVKGRTNVAESLMEYIKPETLEGENMYDAGEHGKQEAEKGTIFVTFPPVLHLHLMRYEFDPIAGESVKFNDRFEFDERMNLDAYMQQPPSPGDAQGPADYTLQAVLVHSGDGVTGHYVVYIDPLCDGRWFKFDDHVVSRCSKFEAIQQNYGGDEMHTTYGFNAYMLVYVRDSDMATVLQPISETDVPVELTERLADERLRERSKSCTFMSINIILEQYLVNQQSTDLFAPGTVPCRTLRVKKTDTVGALLGVLEHQFLTKRERLRMWPLLDRPNLSTRLSVFDWAQQMDTPLSDFADQQGEWSVFVELASGDAVPPFDRSTQIFVFLMSYAPAEKRLKFRGSGYFAMVSTFLDMKPVMCARAGLPNDSKFTIYEDHSSNMMQRVPNQADMLWRVLKVHCRKRRFVETLASWIWPAQPTVRNVDGMVVVFETEGPSTSSNSSYAACTPVRTSNKTTSIHYPAAANARLRPIKKHFKCLWQSINMSEEMELNMLLRNTDTVRTLLEEAAKLVPFNPADGSGRLRIVELQKFLVHPGPPEDELLEHLQTGDQKVYRIEEVPRDEANLAEDELLLSVFRFQADPTPRFGVPFYVRAKHGETYGVVKERIRRKILWDNNVEMKVVLATGVGLNYVADADEVNLEDFRPSDITGILRFGIHHNANHP